MMIIIDIIININIINITIIVVYTFYRHPITTKCCSK